VPRAQQRFLASPTHLPNWKIRKISKALGHSSVGGKYAVRELAAVGYTNMAHCPESKQDWMKAGLPAEKAA
jgi:hypothetical protein